MSDSISLTPLNDVYFKLLFGDVRNIGILSDFLKAVLDLPDSELDHLVLADPHLKRQFIDDKLGVLDVKAYTTTNKVIDIEIQVKKDPDMRERVAIYTAKMLSEQIKRGEDYGKIRQAVSIIIADFEMVPEEKDYLNRYSLRNIKSGKPFTETLEIVTIELGKLPGRDDQSAVYPWLKFLKCRSREECEMLAETKPEVRTVIGSYLDLTEDEEARMLAESRERWAMIQRSCEREARREGNLEVLNLIKQGYTTEQLMEWLSKRV
jgi:predicted transposase/invertase (TIGR01784 family)